jgi:hypothetical protein
MEVAATLRISGSICVALGEAALDRALWPWWGEDEMEERLRLLEKAIATLADELAKVRLQLSGEVEAQRLEIVALKDFLDATFPDFWQRYPPLRESAIRIDRSKGASEQLPSGA